MRAVKNFVLPKSRSPNCGIVGLPNVGKSTIANALAKKQVAQAANYPFCTIEPNVARVDIPDSRLFKLAEIGKSAAIVHSQLGFVDIAGLVKGAHKGEGLGNQFLANIRTTSLLLQVVRCYEDDSVIHVDTVVDPVRDIQTINTELMFADLDSLARRVQKLSKKKDKQSTDLLKTVEIVTDALQNEQLASEANIPSELLESFHTLDLLTAKPIVYLCNVDDSSLGGNKHTKAVAEYAVENGFPTAIMCGKLEEELVSLDDDSRREYMQTYGLTNLALDRVVRLCMENLNLITFYTVGETEARAWVVPGGSTAPQAAGAIHSDLQKGFIVAETIGYDKFVESNGTAPFRKEGRDYICCDGDIFLFRFKV